VIQFVDTFPITLYYKQVIRRSRRSSNTTHVFGRWLVRIQAGTSVSVTRLRGLPQSLQANSRMVSIDQAMPASFHVLANFFSFGL
jgi:hypothetical protein